MIVRITNQIHSFKRKVRFTGASIIAIFSVVVLLFIFFGNHILGLGHVHFAQFGDDFKNYFTLLSYLEQPANTNYLHYDYMNYPFGEHVIYTDNTPLSAVFLKFIKNHTELSAPFLVYLFELTYLFNFILSAILLLRILSRFVSNSLLLIVSTVALTFLHPQSIRLFIGTENLSYSFILLLNLYLIIKISEIYKSKDFRRFLLYVMMQGGVVYFASFIHLYYLIILLIFNIPAYITYFLFLWSTNKKWFYITSVLSQSILVFILVYLTIRVSDNHYLLRRSEAMGFGFDVWSLKISSLFSAYKWNYSNFIISSTKDLNYESLCYLGSLALYGMLCVIIYRYYHKKKYNLPFLDVKNNLPNIILVASLPGLFFSIGKVYYFGANNEYAFNNYFNLAYIAEYFTDKFTHFRCVGRFSWYFFWAFNFAVLYALDRILTKSKWMYIPIIGLSFFVIMDVIHQGFQFRYSLKENCFLAPAYSDEIKMIRNATQDGRYAAMVTLPFFQVGSEDYPNTIDPTFDGAAYFMILSHALKLPMTSFIMSRTPLQYNLKQLEFHSTLIPYNDMIKKSPGSSLLIVRRNDLYQDQKYANMSEETAIKTRDSQYLPEKLGLTRIAQLENVELFELKIPSHY